MSFVPTLCDLCCRARLVDLRDFRERTTPQCPRCGEVLRVVPSPTYTIGDVELFDELSETVADSVSPLDAQHWSGLVEQALWSGTFAKILDSLVVRWPGLAPLRTVVGTNRAQQQRVLQILKTILAALALTRRSETVLVAAGHAWPVDDDLEPEGFTPPGHAPQRTVRHRAR